MHLTDTIFMHLQGAREWLQGYVILHTDSSLFTRKNIAMAAVSSAVGYAVARCIIYNLYFHPVAKIPGPPIDWIPFLGNLRESYLAEPGVLEKRWAKKYGGIVSLYGSWNTPMIMVADPQLLKHIYTHRVYDFTKHPGDVFILEKVLGRGLLLAEGELHRHQRKWLTPAFTAQATRELSPLFYIPSVHLIAKWRQECQEGTTTTLDISHGITLVTLDVIGLGAFGTPFNSVKYDGTDMENELSTSYRILFDPNPSLVQFLSILVPVLRFLPTAQHRRFAKAGRTVTKKTMEIVTQAMANKEETRHKKNLLALMIEQKDMYTGGELSAVDLKNQCMTFLAAGHETTSSALSWCLWLLAQHQDIQDALRDEVKPIFESINLDHAMFQSDDMPEQFDANLPAADTVNQLPLLNNVFKETLRLTPTVPNTMRYTAKDIELGGYHIPKNTAVLLPIIVNLHDPELWGDDVDEFKPERWDSPPASNVSPYEYAPFIAGARQCIGHRFAQLEFKIVLGLLLTHFQFFEEPGYRPSKRQFITMRPNPNLLLRVKPIKINK